MELIVNKPGAELARKDNMNLMPINIAHVCQCPNVGKLLSEKMFSRGVGSQLIHLGTFNWNSMYCSPEVSRGSTYYKIEEPDLLTREYQRRKQNRAECQSVQLKYPTHLWGLVTLEDAAAFRNPPSHPSPPPQERRYSDYMDGVDYDGSPRYVRPTAPRYPSPGRYPAAPANHNAPQYCQPSHPDPMGAQDPRRPIPPENQTYFPSQYADPNRTSAQYSGAPIGSRATPYDSPTYPDHIEGRPGIAPERPQGYPRTVPDRMVNQSPGGSLPQYNSVPGGTSSQSTGRSRGSFGREW
jgi:hypothetical protein